MDNKRLSWTRKYNNNLFIIASRAYFLQSPTCTRVNNLVHITMWLTLTGHITMWPTSKEFTRVNNLVHITMWLTLNEFWFDHVMLVREVISQRVWTFQIRVCFTNIYVILWILPRATWSHFKYLLYYTNPVYYSESSGLVSKFAST